MEAPTSVISEAGQTTRRESSAGLKEPRYDLVRFGSGFPDFRELQTDPKYGLQKEGQLKSGLIQTERWNELALEELEAINCPLAKYRKRLLNSSQKLPFVQSRVRKLISDNEKLELARERPGN